MAIIARQELADIAASLKALLPEGSGFTLIVLPPDSDGPVHVVSNLLDVAGQQALLLAAVDALADPAATSIEHPRARS
ncbi:MAG TPA: hypothetical protein VFB15_11605 [Candidatus Binataceae bacterium]|jgi:hypothetical protein|nr:hypothetical protein [Candidatus Binataceae bacterium]